MRLRTGALVVGMGLILAILWMWGPHERRRAEMGPGQAPAAGVHAHEGGFGNASTPPPPDRHVLINPGATSPAVKRTDTRPVLAAGNDGPSAIASDGTASGPAIDDAGAPTSPTADDPGADQARSRQRFLERRQWRWEDRISEQVAELSAAQQLTQAQRDELFTIMTVANGALRDALREATRSGTPQPATIQRALDQAYAQADREVRELLTDAQYQAYQALRARGGFMGHSPVQTPPPQPAP